MAAGALVLGTTRGGRSVDEASGSDVSLPARLVRPVAFSSEGIPGPWWQAGATRDHFERDLRTCRDRSTAARHAAEPGTTQATAYRSFLECMIGHAWNRGEPVPAGRPGTAADARSEASARTSG